MGDETPHSDNAHCAELNSAPRSQRRTEQGTAGRAENSRGGTEPRHKCPHLPQHFHSAGSCQLQAPGAASVYAELLTGNLCPALCAGQVLPVPWPQPPRYPLKGVTCSTRLGCSFSFSPFPPSFVNQTELYLKSEHPSKTEGLNASFSPS